MTDPEQLYFQKLKKEIEAIYKASYPYCQTSIEEWKGQDIVNFQEDLIKKVSGRISEKWFYTHIKAKQEKIPRLDMLNMLSQYAGYKDWQHFTALQADLQKPEKEDIIIQKPLEEIKPEKIIRQEPLSGESKSKSAVWLFVSILIAVGLVIYLFFNREKTYQFCFIDGNIKDAVQNVPIDIIILNENESPVYMHADSGGCFSLTTQEEEIKFIVKSPYYKTDTIIRLLNKNESEAINLNTDDYALMIHYFSTAKVEDWKNRRNKLSEIFAEEAKIFQLHPDGQTGMELYNKQEFIDKLTIPVNSLRNIDVIGIQYRNGQICELKFRQLTDKMK